MNRFEKLITTVIILQSISIIFTAVSILLYIL